jgi:hypothetical protein
MDNRTLTALAFRLAGIYTLIQASYQVVSAIFLLASGEGPQAESGWGYATYTWAAVFLGFGCVLLFGADKLAARVTRGAASGGANSTMAPATVERIGYRLLGVYAIITFAPALTSDVIAMLISSDNFEAGFPPYLWSSVTTSICGLLIALWLLLGARGMSGLIDRVRGAGLQESERGWKA